MTKTTTIVLAALVIIVTIALVSQKYRSAPTPAAPADPHPVSASAAPAKAVAASQPIPARAIDSAPIPQGSLLERVAQLPPLTASQIESYVMQNKRTAESLLAAYRMGTNRAYLVEAANRFPDDPDVQYAVVATRAFPEVRRQWIDTYKTSSPDNALPWYFSALDLFQGGKTAQAVQELTEATRKPVFRAELAPTIQAVEEMNVSAGRAADEAKVAAFQAVAQGLHLGSMRELAKTVQAAVQQYRQQGDAAFAASLANMGLALGSDLSAGGGSQTLINQLVGIGIEKMFLRELDPNQSRDASGQSVSDLSRAIEKHQTTLKDLAKSMAELTRTLADAELANYMERVKLHGEEAALTWLRNKHGQP